MARRFFGKEIKVTTSGEIKTPAAFVLDGQEYVIEEIIDAWFDSSFGKNPLSRNRWWQRHHRNYYRVKTTDGEVYEIYYDRGVSLEHPEYKKWFITHRF